MKKVSATHPDSLQGGCCDKLYEYMNAILTGKPQEIADTFGEEFINSLLQRCGLVEVRLLSTPRTTTSSQRTIASTYFRAIPTATFSSRHSPLVNLPVGCPRPRTLEHQWQISNQVCGTARIGRPHTHSC